MKTVYLVRHGQTDANIYEYAQGAEEPLNDTGWRQAYAVAERAQNLNFEVIISSDMKRAVQTAHAIAEATKRQVITEPLLREVCYPEDLNGYDESGDKAARKEQFRKELLENLDNPDWHAYGVENQVALVARAQQVLQFLEEREEEKLLIVSHGNFLKTLVGHIIMGISEVSGSQGFRFRRSLKLDNTGLSTITFDEEERRWSLYQWNDRAHFAE